MTDGQTAEVAIVDSYEVEEKFGGLKIVKSFDGANVTKEEAEGALTFQVTTVIEETTYYVDKDGNLTTEEKTLTLNDGFVYDETAKTFTKTFANDKLPVGEYTVTEKDTEIDGYEFKGSTVNGTDGTTATIDVTDGQTAEVAIVDSYEVEEKFGGLKIVKSFDGANVTKEEAEGALTFQVTTVIEETTYYVDKDGNLTTEEKTLTLNDGFVYDETAKTFTKTFPADKLPIGEYTVTEKDTEIDGYEFTGSTVNDEEGTSTLIDVTEGNVSEVEIVDKYDYISTFANLVAKKYFVDEEGNDLTLAKDQFSFKLQGYGATAATSQTKKNTANGTVTFDKLTFDAPGIYKYKITEVKGNEKGVEYSVAVYDVTIEVTQASGVGLLAEVSYSKGTLPVGEAAFINVKSTTEEEQKYGGLKIIKSFDGDNVTKAEAEGALTFQVTTVIEGTTYYVDKDGNLTTEEVTLTLKDGFKYDKKTKTFTKVFPSDKLPVGEYTVTETNTEIDGYEFKGSTVNGEDGTSTVIDVTEGNTSEVEIVDKYEKDTEDTGTEDTGTEDTGTEDTGTEDTGTEDTGTEDTGTGDTGDTGTEDTTDITTETDDTGNLIIIVTDEETGEVVPGATVEVEYPDGKTETFVTDDEGKITIKDVPPGDYTITVIDVPEGYDVTTDEEVEVTVVAGDTVEYEVKILTSTDATTTEGGGTDAVKTDDPTNTVPYLFAMLISCAGIVYVTGRKKKLNK